MAKIKIKHVKTAKSAPKACKNSADPRDYTAPKSGVAEGERDFTIPKSAN